MQSCANGDSAFIMFPSPCSIPFVRVRLYDVMSDREAVMQKVDALVDEYRGRCLWFLRADFYPQTDEEILRTLGYIERYGDVVAFQKAATLRQWLLQNTSALSAA